MGARVKIDTGKAVVACPGCGSDHEIDLGMWEWDGGTERPSFHPNLQFVARDNDGVVLRCHARIVDGVWHYLPDSTHGLAGQSVAVPERW